jgi:glutamine cyclotransferase
MVRKRKNSKSKQDKNDEVHVSSVNNDRCSSSNVGSDESKKKKKQGGTSRIVFVIVAIEILALTVFLLLQGENNRYFSNRDFISIRKSATKNAAVSSVKETQQTNDEFNPIGQEPLKDQEKRRSIVFGPHKVLESYDHDSHAFTQGLTYFNGYIYESTGIYGRSSVRKLDPNNNFEVVQEVSIDKKFFGEGMTHYKTSEGDDMFVVLTWKEGTAFIYDHNLNLMESFKYQTETGEGWGITYNTDRGQIIVSDGSEHLYVFDLSTRQGRQRLKVHGYIDEDSEARGINMINELEYVSPKDGKTPPYILANVWFQNYILKIDPDTGRVTTLYDLSELCPELKYGSEDVLNGISVTSDSDHRIVYITGKLWDKMYKIMLL